MIYNTRSRKRKHDDLTNRSLKEDLEPKTHKSISLKGEKTYSNPIQLNFGAKRSFNFEIIL